MFSNKKQFNILIMISLSNVTRATLCHPSWKKFKEILLDPSDHAYKDRVLLFKDPNGENKDPKLSFLEISSEYVDLVWDRIVDERGKVCPEYQRFSQLLSTVDYEEESTTTLQELQTNFTVMPIEVKNLSACGGGGYVRFRRKDILESFQKDETH